MNSKLNHIQNWPELAQEAEWSAAKLAKKCGVSMRKLERHFLKIMGKSPKAWLTEQRQHQADEMLRQGLPVKVIAPRSDTRDQTTSPAHSRSIPGIAPP